MKGAATRKGERPQLKKGMKKTRFPIIACRNLREALYENPRALNLGERRIMETT